MKKVIKGKKLDTTTAKMIGIAMIDEDKDIVETLYRTKSGTYFIHNVYRKSTTGKLETGEDIYLISANEAVQWAEKWLTPAEYNRWFGEGKADETVTVTVTLTSKAYNILKKEKELTGDTYGEIISYAIGLIQ